MKNFSAVFALLIGCIFLSSCSLEAAPAGNAKGKRGLGAVPKTLRISAYIAKADSTSGLYSADGQLIASDQVNVAAEMSGKLVKLYAKDGMKVSAGTLLAKIEDAELKANLKNAQANLELAKKKAARLKTLYEKDGATAEELESAESAVVTAEASVDLIQAQLKKTEIRSPFAGILGTVDLSEGAWLTAGSKIATLTNTQELKVEFELPQRYSQKLKIGDKVELLDAERNLKIAGTVRFMDATLSSTSRTRKVRAVVKNAGGKYLAGTYVRVELHFAGGEFSGIPIPAEALTLDANGAYVFLMQAGKANKVYVKTGLRTPITVDVMQGIAEGDTVVVSGLMSVREGSSLEIKDIANSMNYGVHE